MAKVFSGLELLTEREADVLACLADGLSNNEIAERLFLSPSTVKWYVRQLNNKLSTTNRDEIVEQARVAGLLDKGKAQVSTAQHNLPYQTTLFVGRNTELDELARILESPEVRLVTILAPGGMGKTRLALKAAEQQLYNFPNGVYFVPLQALGEVEQIIPAVAQHIGFQFVQDERSAKQQLLDYLRGKMMLLVVDNWEHLLDGATLVSDILQAAPGVKVLATSREKLNLSGETVYTLRGMDFSMWETPEDALCCDAVKLLVQAAKRIQPEFAVTENNLDYVARVCHLTEGMPLAILLAAGWLDTLSLERIAEEIQKNVDFLETAIRDIPERQRSIRAIFKAAWERLTPAEQRLFMKLTVFRGGCTPEAAEAVTGATPRALQTLVNKALVLRKKEDRYDIHELLRQYGYVQLEASGQLTETMRQHSVYYAGFLYEREEDVKGRRQLAAIDEIEAELDNIRQSWYQALEDEDIVRIEQSSFSLLRYVLFRSREVEFMPLFADAEAALRSKFDTHRGYGRLLAYLGEIRGILTRYQESERLLREAWTIAQAQDDSKGMAYSSLELARVLYYGLSKQDEAKQLVEESIRISEAIGDQWNLACALFHKGNETAMSGKAEEGLVTGRRALDIFRQLGDEIGVSGSLILIGAALFHMGQYKEREALIREALALRKRLKIPRGVAFSLIQVTISEFHTGSVEMSRQYAEELLQLAREYGFPDHAASALLLLSFISIVSDQFDEAEQKSEEAMRLVASELAASYVLPRGFIQLARCNWVGARTALIEYLRQLFGDKADLMWVSILGMGLVIAEEGQIERGLELASLALNNFLQMPKAFANCPLVWRHLEAIKGKLGAEAYATAWERGKTLDFNATVAELIAEYGKAIPSS